MMSLLIGGWGKKRRWELVREMRGWISDGERERGGVEEERDDNSTGVKSV